MKAKRLPVPRILSLATGLVVAIICLASVDAGAASAAVQWRKIGDTPGFPGLHDELRTIVKEDSRDKMAVFCVMLEDTSNHQPVAYALWESKHLLYRWYATSDAMISDATLIHHAPLDLRKDIIRTKVDRLSTFLVSRSWARDVESQCRQHGELVKISRGEK